MIPLASELRLGHQAAHIAEELAALSAAAREAAIREDSYQLAVSGLTLRWLEAELLALSLYLAGGTAAEVVNIWQVARAN